MTRRSLLFALLALAGVFVAIGYHGPLRVDVCIDRDEVPEGGGMVRMHFDAPVEVAAGQVVGMRAITYLTQQAQ